MKIARVESLVYGVEDVDAGIRYYEDWGLACVELGSNLFWYFNNPCGRRTEYYADMDQMDDDWKPRIWEKNPGFAMWMLDKADAPELTRI